MSFFMAKCSYYPIGKWLLITHAHIPPQHMLIFATRMGNMSMFSKFCFFNNYLIIFKLG